MKVKDIKDIEIRLEELDRMESQILFSVSILSADDHVRLARQSLIMETWHCRRKSTLMNTEAVRMLKSHYLE